MRDNTGRVVIALLLMVAVWIGVYWWWPVEPPVSLARSGDVSGAKVTTIATERATKGMPGAAPYDPPAPETKTGNEAKPATPAAGDRAASQPSAPAGAAPVPGVIIPTFMEHTVAKGETFASISRAYYGTAEYADAISTANALVSAGELKEGRVLRIPRDPKNVQGTPATKDGAGVRPAPSQVAAGHAGAGQEYVVQKGDVLGKISQKVYGTSKHAQAIFEANKDKLASPDKLREGQKLRIPPKPAETETPR